MTNGNVGVKYISPHVMRLYKAVANYVNRCGGIVLVCGGIQVQKWPGDPPMNFTLGIKCTGVSPKFSTGWEGATDAPKRKRRKP